MYIYISVLLEHPYFGDVSVAQLVVSMSGEVLGGVVVVVGSNLARGEIFTASISSVDLLHIYIYITSLFWGCLSGAVGSVNVW